LNTFARKHRSTSYFAPAEHAATIDVLQFHRKREFARAIEPARLKLMFIMAIERSFPRRDSTPIVRGMSMRFTDMNDSRHSRSHRSRSLRRRSARPAVEPLETRELLSVVDQGGPVLANAQVETVFLGSQWNSDPAQAGVMNQLNTYVSTLVSGSYFNLMTPYGIGAGTLTGSLVANTNLPAGSQISDSQIQSAILNELNSGAVSNNSERLFVVYTPQNVEVSASGATSGTEPGLGHFAGYHNNFIDPATNQSISYAVIPFPGGINGVVAPLNVWQLTTVATSHEIAEGVTDPDPSTNPAWLDPNSTSNLGSEIGDLAWGNFGFWNGYVVQALAAPNDQPTLPVGSTPFLMSAAGPFIAPEGTSFTTIVASFTDLDTSYSQGPRTAGDFTATVAWGNGQTSPGTVVQTGPGQFEIVASYAYPNAGGYTVSIGVTDMINGQSMVVAGTANVSDQPIVATSAPSGLAAARSYNQHILAHFIDLNPYANATDFSASIDWGNGQTSAGYVVATASGFEVIGANAYQTPGFYPVTVTIVDSEGSRATASGVLDVVRPGAAGSIAFGPAPAYHRAFHPPKIFPSFYQSFNGSREGESRLQRLEFAYRRNLFFHPMETRRRG
jgi:hypothetical protein